MASNRRENVRIYFFNVSLVIAKITKKKHAGIIHQTSINFENGQFHRLSLGGFQCEAQSMSKSYSLEYSSGLKHFEQSFYLTDRSSGGELMKRTDTS